jgi:hypothetical protein
LVISQKPSSRLVCWFLTTRGGLRYTLLTWHHCGTDLDHLAEVVLFKTVQCKVTVPSPSFPTELFGRKSLCDMQPTLKKYLSSPSWRSEFLVNYLEFFFPGDLSFGPIYLYQFRLIDIYFILWVTVQVPVCCLRCSRFGHSGDSFDWLSAPWLPSMWRIYSTSFISVVQDFVDLYFLSPS